MPMSDKVEKLKQFVEYAGTLSGDEKSEAQVFCDRLFQAFGHAGYKEAGAELEFRVKRKGKAGERDTTSFADLVWPGRVLLEMKKSDAKLQLHFQQAFDYWLHIVPDGLRHVRGGHGPAAAWDRPWADRGLPPRPRQQLRPFWRPLQADGHA